MAAGTLTAAAYTASYSYDTLNRLTSAPLGSYSYGDTSHLDAATAIGAGASSWTASYDAAGNMTCRAASGATTCAGGTPNGALLSWDNEGRLTAWQNVASVTTSPSSTPALEEALYDGAGQRVVQLDASNATQTTTQHTYVQGILGSGSEDVASQWANTGSGGVTTTTTAYYAGYAGGLAESVNGLLSYLLSDGLGSVSASVGAVNASQLYSPYGGARSQSGTLPTDYGFTGQRSDASTSGLDDYGARFYDPVAGQFTSADTMLAGGLNRYAYVGGNPETFVDPSGHMLREGIEGEGGGLPGGEGTPGGGEASGDAWGASGDPNGGTSSLSPSMTVGDELTYDAGSAGADSFHVDATGAVDGVEGPDGQVLESNAQIAAQAEADAQDRLNKGEQPQTNSTVPTRSPTAGDAPTGNPSSTIRLGGNDGTTGSRPGEPGGFGKLTGVQIHVTPEGLSMVETHLGNQFFDQAPENAAMIGRLRLSMENNEPVTGADASFYMHEVTEYNLMKDAPYTDEAYSAAHKAALDKYGVSPFSVYHPDVISRYPGNFNKFWLAFWGL